MELNINENRLQIFFSLFLFHPTDVAASICHMARFMAYGASVGLMVATNGCDLNHFVLRLYAYILLLYV